MNVHGPVCLLDIEPTIFFKRSGGLLLQRAWVKLVDGRAPESDNSRLYLSVKRAGAEHFFHLAGETRGAVSHEIYLPDNRLTEQLCFRLHLGDTVLDERIMVWQPEKHWEVHLIHYSHHDLGYTELPSIVLQRHADYLEEVVELCAQTDDWPEEARFRYLIEQTWSLLHFIETRPLQQVERFMAYVRQGRIEVTALFGNQTTELCGHEELIRLLYPAFQLKRRFGIEIVSAEHNDIPGVAWGLASVLAGAGIRYFSPGFPSWYFGEGQARQYSLWDENAVLSLDIPGAFWWEAPDGERILFWSDLHGRDWHPTSLAQIECELPALLENLQRCNYAPDIVSYTVRGGMPDNTPATLRYATLARDWNKDWAYPKLISSTNRRFLDAFSHSWTDSLPVWRGDIPGTDYPIAATCTPKETAVNRRTHDRLCDAEKLAAMASLITSVPYPRESIEQAYLSLFRYDCHCWGLSQPGGPAQDASWNEKAGYAYRAAALSHDLLVKAMNQIADEIAYPEAGYYVTVFNTLNWSRDSLVRLHAHTWDPASKPPYWRNPSNQDASPTLALGGAYGRSVVNLPLELLESPFVLVDLQAGTVVEHDVAWLDDPLGPQPWAPERFALGQVQRQYLAEIRFNARDLPALGYKTYELRPLESSAGIVTHHAKQRNELENEFYRVRIDPDTGSIVSIVDKQQDLELVDTEAEVGFGRLVGRWPATGEIQRDCLDTVQEGAHGILMSSIRMQGHGPGVPAYTKEIVLHHKERRIDLNVRLLRDSTPLLELYVAFPFLVADPRFRFEAANSVVEATVDQLPGTRTDFYAFQHWIELTSKSKPRGKIVWSSLDAPVAALGKLWPGSVSGAHHGIKPAGHGYAPVGSSGFEHGHIYSLAMYNNFRTNFLNVHSGEFVLQYSFCSFSDPSAGEETTRYGWQISHPPYGMWMQGPQAGRLGTAASVCRIMTEAIVVLTVKLAEDGNGFILRLMESIGREVEAHIELPAIAIRVAYQTNLVEEDLYPLETGPNTIRVRFKPRAIVTIRVVPY